MSRVKLICITVMLSGGMEVQGKGHIQVNEASNSNSGVGEVTCCKVNSGPAVY